MSLEAIRIMTQRLRRVLDQGLHTSTALASTLGPTTHQPPVGAPQAAAASAPADPSDAGSAAQRSGSAPPQQHGATAGAGAAMAAAAGKARQNIAGAAAAGGGGGWANVPPVARTLGLAGDLSAASGGACCHFQPSHVHL